MKNYPVGHKDYGKMGPMTEKESMNMPMANRTIQNLEKNSSSFRLRMWKWKKGERKK